jgi:hypothetical protein
MRLPEVYVKGNNVGVSWWGRALAGVMGRLVANARIDQIPAGSGRDYRCGEGTTESTGRLPRWAWRPREGRLWWSRRG